MPLFFSCGWLALERLHDDQDDNRHQHQDGRLIEPAEPNMAVRVLLSLKVFQNSAA
jgi:hypothetical protein